MRQDLIDAKSLNLTPDELSDGSGTNGYRISVVDSLGLIDVGVGDWELLPRR
jgi:hypothetical protein